MKEGSLVAYVTFKEGMMAGKRLEVLTARLCAANIGTPGEKWCAFFSTMCTGAYPYCTYRRVIFVDPESPGDPDELQG